MNSLKKRFLRWFRKNFFLIRQGKGSWVIQSKSRQGCLLFLPLFLVCIGYTIFLLFKIYPLIFSTLMTRLGIASYLSVPLLIACFFGNCINLPLFILTANHRSIQQVNFELFPIWLLKCWCLPSYKNRYKPYSYIGLNVSGALIPIVLALYQFHRVRPSAILIVTAIISLIEYFLVVVIPERCVYTTSSKFWLTPIIAALSAMAIVAGGESRFDVSVAFAGGVLGTTIGADLLHFKDVCPEKAEVPLSIGGAGLKDGIVLSGFYALILAEWLPAVITRLSAYFP